jgi:hypothetical protein
MMRRGFGGMPTQKSRFTASPCKDGGAVCYLMLLPLPLALVTLPPAPVEVSLLVCISSPIYLFGG